MEEPGVASVCSINRIDDVADDGNQTDRKVEHDVGNHFGVESGRQTTVDLGSLLYQPQGHHSVREITDTG